MRTMRRSDRQIPLEEALEVLRRAEYGVLSTADGDGRPYGVPLSFVLLDDTVYFHCAHQGHKVDNIAANGRVCFTAVHGTRPFSPAPGSFSTTFESAVLFGTTALVTGEAERTRALTGLVAKYFPHKVDEAALSIQKMGGATAVYKILADAVTGKARRQP